MSTHTHAHTHTHMCTHTHTHTHVHTHANTHAHTQHMHNTCTSQYKWMQALTYTLLAVYLYAQICTHIKYTSHTAIMSSLADVLVGSISACSCTVLPTVLTAALAWSFSMTPLSATAWVALPRTEPKKRANLEASPSGLPLMSSLWPLGWPCCIYISEECWAVCAEVWWIGKREWSADEKNGRGDTWVWGVRWWWESEASLGYRV